MADFPQWSLPPTEAQPDQEGPREEQQIFLGHWLAWLGGRPLPEGLRDELERIAEGSQLPPELREELAPIAGALAGRRDYWSVEELGDITAPREARALALGLLLVIDERLAFWAPVLELCAAGKTLAPVPDLKRVRALLQAVRPPLLDEPGDPALALLDAGLERLARYVDQGGSTAQGGYQRTPAPPPPPEPAAAPQADPQRGPRLRRLALALSLLACLVGALYGERWFASSATPPPTVQDYRAVLPTLVDKRVEDGLLVVELDRAWRDVPPEERQAQVLQLLESTGGEAFDRLEVRVQGLRAVVVGEDGILRWTPAWAPEGWVAPPE